MATPDPGGTDGGRRTRAAPLGIRAELGIPKRNARAAASAPGAKPRAGVTIGIVQRGKDLRKGFEVVSGHGEGPHHSSGRY
jgi:hypothetical protein